MLAGSGFQHFHDCLEGFPGPAGSATLAVAVYSARFLVVIRFAFPLMFLTASLHEENDWNNDTLGAELSGRSLLWASHRLNSDA